jgi:hypothetical protein
MTIQDVNKQLSLKAPTKAPVTNGEVALPRALANAKARCESIRRQLVEATALTLRQCKLAGDRHLFAGLLGELQRLRNAVGKMDAELTEVSRSAERFSTKF